MSQMTTEDRELLEAVATCLEYPGADFEGKATPARQPRPDASEAMARLGEAMKDLAAYLEREGEAVAEERYTQLFDLSPVCSLHLGYHLFGDAYERGELLAGLVRELTAARLDFAHELPDFLPTVLRLLPRMHDEQDRKLLVAFIIVPGLDKIVTALEDATDPWTSVLITLRAVILELVPVGKIDHDARKGVVLHA